MKVEPRWYQVDNINNVLANFDFSNPLNSKHRVQFLQAPCGYGKTFAFSYIANKCIAATNGSTLVAAHREELVLQPAESYFGFFGGHSDIIKSGYARSHSFRFKVGAIQTLYPRLNKFSVEELLGEVPKLLIVDEAHLCKAKTWKYIFDMFPNSCILLCSATPTRLDGQGFDDMATHMEHGPSVKEMEQIFKDDPNKKLGLVPDWIIPIRLIPDMKKMKIKNGEYDHKPMNAMLNNWESCNAIVDSWEKYSKDTQTLAYCFKSSSNMDMGMHQRLAEAFSQRGYRAAYVDGKTDKTVRRDLFKAFKAGELNILTNMEIVTVGTDLPNIETTLSLAKTTSLAGWLQASSRGKRPNGPSKMYHKILDFVGNVDQLGAPNEDHEWSLKGVKKKKKKRNVIQLEDGTIMDEKEFSDFDNHGHPMTYEILDYYTDNFRVNSFQQKLEELKQNYRNPEDATRAALEQWYVEVGYEPDFIEMVAIGRQMFPDWDHSKSDSWAASRYERFKAISKGIEKCTTLEDGKQLLDTLENLFMINTGKVKRPLPAYYQLRSKITNLIRSRYDKAFIPRARN